MTRSLLVLLAALALSFHAFTGEPEPSPGGGERQLTVERLYTDPPLGGRLPRQVRFAPDGARLTFLEAAGDDDGPPSLWQMDVETGERSVLVAADAMPEGADEEEDDDAGEEGPSRFRIGSYQWSPVGSHLLISSSGDLFVAEVEGGKIRRLTETEEDESDPKFSPDGKWVSFVREHNLHAVPVGGGKERALTRQGSEEVLLGEPDWVSCEELSLCSAYWWSPDSTRLALLRFDQSEVYRYPLADWLEVHAGVEWERYPKAGDPNAKLSLGVVGLDGEAPRWLETGADPEDYLARVQWAGDSLLVQMLNRGQDHLRLVRLNLEGGRETLLEERDDHWVNLSDDLKLLDDGRILWSSERDGWRHLYLHDGDGALLRRLTQGEWTVTEVEGVDEASGTVFFTATEKSHLERHLYRVGLDGKGFRRVSSEAGTHDVTLAPQGKRYVGRHSTRQQPWRLALRRADGSLAVDLAPEAGSDLAGYALPRHRFLEVPAADGTLLQAEMLVPRDFDPSRRYPVLVYVYGGPHAQVVRDSWSGGSGLWHAMMVERGYLVFSVDNRGSFARGHAWETAIDRRMGHVELEDQLAGVRYLRSLPYVDPYRLGIWGWSYGGYMTLFALANAPGTFRVGIAVAPVSDWKLYDTIYTERYMERPQENPDGYRDSSPVNQAASLQGRLLLVHGTGDDNVHVQNSVQMIHRMVQAGISYDFQLYPRQKHGIRATESRVHLFRRMTRFLLDHL